jgi:glycosyltransferase involved in cell wall biosynthesis
MDTVKRILVIAYVFPPIAYAGTYRIMRICKHLTRMGFRVTVLTISRQPDLYNDDSLLQDLDGSIRIERTRTFDLWRKYQPWKVKFLRTFPGRMLNSVFSRLLHFLCLPDHMNLWPFFAVQRAKLLMRKEKYDIIFSTSPPHSQQLIGWYLKRRTGVKWISDLRDPILDNQDAENWDRVERWVNKRLEERILYSADVVVANTRSARGSLQQRYPRTRIELVYNSYDEDEFKGITEQKFEHFTVAHIGSIYSFRKVDLLFEAVRNLAEKKLIHERDFRLLFVGMYDPALPDKISRYGITQYVVMRDMVAHQQALQVMFQSHLLLLVKGLGKNSNSQIPGKLFEYLGTGNEIIGLVPLNSEAADIIRETKSGLIVENDGIQLEAYLLKKYDQYKMNKINASIRSTYDTGRFSSRCMAETVRQIIDSLLI